MKIKWGGRGTGKTMAMLDWLEDNPTGILLTVNEREADRLRRGLADEIGRRILAAKRGCLRGQRYDLVAFDNLDLYFFDLFGGPIDLATATKEK